MHSRFHELMHEIFQSNNLRVRFNNRCTTYRLERGEALRFDYTVPEDVELKALNPSEYTMMDEAWPYRYPGSDSFIRSLIVLNGGLGVYRNGELVSWILQIECFGIGLLQTLDAHQGRGYARLLTRAMTQKISETYNEDVILFASHSKPKTVELYDRYGFKHVSYTHWFYLEPIPPTVES